MDRSQYCLEKGLNSSWKFFAFVLVAVCFWEDTFAQVEHLTNDIRVDEEPTSSFSGFPAVAVDSNDGFLIVWGDNLFDQGKVLARRFNSIGEPLGPEFQVDQSDQGEAAVSFNGGFGFADLIDIAVNNNDEFIIVWQDIRT
ncbi:hypothetical protein GWO43_10675, partial [candidate division KSB1 bacterium]|nr:hypothetical protein [candidate division KSB1 bacterium]NIS24400.1 hypothetical protein [candidate division KSB1 bacterium]NIT71335.1 hypothetical protein [candidate division KSB1 bacterium]NIU25015.1 hypothetical protein [candidate division KSB1 bacterium]NIU91037.1 hypothetical protein [candidate division KSB1 bacterium]